MDNIMRRPLYLDGLAIIAGVLLTLAFAPFHFKALGIISPALLLITWLNTSYKRALWRGWLFGLAHFGTGVYWVYISIHSFGGASSAIAFLITALFIAVLALFPAAQGLVLNLLFKQALGTKCETPFKNNNAAKCLFGFPSLWVLFEALRGIIFTGFPWLILGDSQLHSPIANYAPLISDHGVSLMATLTSGILVYLYFANKKPRVYCLIALATIWLFGFALGFYHFTETLAPQSVTLVQGNIAQTLKWQPSQAMKTIEKYTALSKPYWRKNNIVIWPEAAVPLLNTNATDVLDPIITLASEQQSTLITGIPIQNVMTDAVYNGIIAAGSSDGFYLKRHLVPFGEYAPIPAISRPILNWLQIPMSDFTKGPDSQPNIIINDIQFASFICYEIAYSNEIRKHLGQSNVILLLSDDAWFGRSIAQAQHLEIAQMRSLETGRYTIVTSNNGYTSIINDKGMLDQCLPTHITAVLNGFFLPTKGSTPWLLLGPLSYLLIAFLLLIIGIKRRDQ